MTSKERRQMNTKEALAAVDKAIASLEAVDKYVSPAVSATLRAARIDLACTRCELAAR